MNPHIEPTKASYPKEGFIPNPKLKLLDQLREVLRFKHYSIRTEEAYLNWVVRFLKFHRRASSVSADGWRHPRELGAPEVQAFLNDSQVKNLPERTEGKSALAAVGGARAAGEAGEQSGRTLGRD